MSVLINIEMPKEPDEMIEIAIFGDGKVIQTGESWRNLENGKCYYTTTTPEKFFNAVLVPSHGRLIDADALCSRFDNAISTISALPVPSDFVELYKQLVSDVKEEVMKCHTIIPASAEGE